MDKTILNIIHDVEYDAWKNFRNWAMTERKTKYPDVDLDEFVSDIALPQNNAFFSETSEGFRCLKFNTIEDKMVFILRWS